MGTSQGLAQHALLLRPACRGAMTETLPKVTKKKGPRPGNRKGGMPPGHVTAKTIEKEAAKAALRQIVLEELRPLVRAQIDSAKGIAHFMLRDPENGQFKRLTDPAEIEQALNAPGASEGSTYWIYVKDPQTPAFVTLMDRAMGKPVEEVQMELTVNEPLDKRVKEAKKRIGRS